MEQHRVKEGGAGGMRRREVTSPVATRDEEGKVAKRKKIDREGGNKKEVKKTQICKPKGVCGLDRRANKPMKASR
jgi:hypothetical protein